MDGGGARGRILLACSLWLLAAPSCYERPRTARSLEIPGSRTIGEQAAIAERVMAATSLEEVRADVLVREPGLDASALEGLVVRVQLPPGAPQAIPGTQGRVWCELRHPRDRDAVAPILRHCIEHMRVHLSAAVAAADGA